MEDPEKCLVKAELARKISVAIEEMGLTQAAAAALLEDRPLRPKSRKVVMDAYKKIADKHALLFKLLSDS